MPIVYNLDQNDAPSPDISPSLLSDTSTSRPSYSSPAPTWGVLSSPWLCVTVLSVAVLLIRRWSGRSRVVSMSQAETPKSTKTPTPSSKWPSDDRLRPEKESFLSTSATWSPTIATVIKHGHHASGSGATTTTGLSPMRNVFPYPNPPSPTLSPMSEENEEQSRDIPTLDKKESQNQDNSPTSPSTSSTSTTATAPSQLPTPPRRRSYTKTSIVPVSPPRAYTFPITADESEFQFGTGSDPLNPPPPMPLVLGIELSEEVIIAAEGWRRHTRVYGGGVCRACEESEEQMRLMGVKPVEMDA